jgi:hypothetical protein
MLKTPFYKTIVADDDPDGMRPYSNYHPYHLFCLGTKIRRDIQQLRPEHDMTYFITERPSPEIKLSFIFFQVLQDGDPTRFSSLEEKHLESQILKYSQSLKCLIFPFDYQFYDSKDRPISVPYSSLMLANLLFSEIPIEAEEDGIFADLSWATDYLDFYNKIQEQIFEEIQKRYQRGDIPLPKEEIIKEWRLVKVSHKEDEIFYRPTWEEGRIDRLYEFLLDQNEDRHLLQFEIPRSISNLNLFKHFLSQELTAHQFRFNFEDRIICVEIKTMNQLQIFLASYQKYRLKIEGDVGFIYLKTSDELALIRKIANDRKYYETTWFSTSNPSYPYVFSVLTKDDVGKIFRDEIDRYNHEREVPRK